MGGRWSSWELTERERDPSGKVSHVGECPAGAGGARCFPSGAEKKSCVRILWSKDVCRDLFRLQIVLFHGLPLPAGEDTEIRWEDLWRRREMAEKTLHFTENMRSIALSSWKEIQTYYSREDYEEYLNGLEKASEENRGLILGQLETMCEARGWKLKELLADRTLLNQVPTRAELLERIPETFYKIYQNAPSSVDLITRTVQELTDSCPPDSVRLAILRKIVEGSEGKNFCGYHVDTILDWVRARLTGEESAQLDALPKKKHLNFLISHLEDAIFAELEEKERVQLDAAERFILVAQCNSEFQTKDDLTFSGMVLSPESAAWIDQLFSGSGDPDVADLTATEKLERIASALQSGRLSREVFAERESEVAALEAEFGAQLKKVERRKANGQMGTAQEMYVQRQKDRRKALEKEANRARPDKNLLRMCDDLAGGVFRQGGVTKKYIYYFAFFFGMTVDVKPGEDYAHRLGFEQQARDLELDPVDSLEETRVAATGVHNSRDLVSNLLQGYYSEDMLSFLRSGALDKKNESTLEREPTGEGINYKNYMEVIYVYYLCHPELYKTPAQGIRMAEGLMRRCRQRQRVNTEIALKNAQQNTVFFRNKTQDLQDLDEEDLCEEICENFVLYGGGGVSGITIGEERHTASGELFEAAADLREEHQELAEMTYGQRRVPGREDTARRQERQLYYDPYREIEWALLPALREKYGDDETFMRVLDALKDRTGYRCVWPEKDTVLRALALLRVLGLQKKREKKAKDEGKPAAKRLSRYLTNQEVEKCGVPCSDAQRSEAAELLKEIGYVVESPSKKNQVWLENKWEDLKDDELFQAVTGRYYQPGNGSTVKKLEDLWMQSISRSRKVTRNQLLTERFYHFLTLLKESFDGTESFPDIFLDFSALVDPDLEAAGFQLLSEKNIYDMYLIYSLFYYLAQEGGC